MKDWAKKANEDPEDKVRRAKVAVDFVKSGHAKVKNSNYKWISEQLVEDAQNDVIAIGQKIKDETKDINRSAEHLANSMREGIDETTR